MPSCACVNTRTNTQHSNQPHRYGHVQRHAMKALAETHVKQGRGQHNRRGLHTQGVQLAKSEGVGVLCGCGHQADGSVQTTRRCTPRLQAALPFASFSARAKATHLDTKPVAAPHGRYDIGHIFGPNRTRGVHCWYHYVRSTRWQADLRCLCHVLAKCGVHN